MNCFRIWSSFLKFVRKRFQKVCKKLVQTDRRGPERESTRTALKQTRSRQTGSTQTNSKRQGPDIHTSLDDFQNSQEAQPRQLLNSCPEVLQHVTLAVRFVYIFSSGARLLQSGRHSTRHPLVYVARGKKKRVPQRAIM